MKKTLSRTLCTVAFGLAAVQTAEAAKTLNILLPNESEWQGDIPTLSYTDNGEKKTIDLVPVANKCGWLQATFDKAPNDAIIGLKYNSELKLGVNGLWDNDDKADPIDLKNISEALKTDNLYFIPDDLDWPSPDGQGWFAEFPDVLGICQFNLASIIYDQSQNTLLTPTADSSGCNGLQKGIVKTELSEDAKPVFSDSENAKKCFNDAASFNNLFKTASDPSTMQCLDMPFKHYDGDFQWVTYADSTTSTISNTSMFCGESHATFTYFEGMNFTLSNLDDMWVFINGKLAIDKGGSNDTTPVQFALKDLNTTYGKDFLVSGRDYSLEIFYCNRHSGAPSLNVKANMFVKQSTGIDLTAEEVENGLKFNICTVMDFGGDCESLALISASENIKCGEEITSPIKYSITTRTGEQAEGCDICSALPAGQVSLGGFDLTNPKVPVINQQRITGLQPGTYRFYIEIGGKRVFYQFRIHGETEAIHTSGAKIAQSGFDITMAGQHQFAIVTSSQNLSKTYVVMDLQGKIVNKGVINSTEMLVPALIPGSYVVKIGADYRRVNVR